MIFVLLFFAFGSSRPVISPSNLHAITSGTSIQFKSNIPVKWSLAPGSPGNIDDTGTYHAPVHIQAKNTIAGCQVLPNDHVFNTRIDTLPISPKSPEWISIAANTRLNYYPSWGTNIADSSTPRVNTHFLYTAENDGKYAIPAWPDLQRENGVFSRMDSGVDRHVVTLDRQSCTFYELYNNYSAGDYKECPTCTANSGVIYSSMSYNLPTNSSDAAGLFLEPLTIHLSEVMEGRIRHAARFTMPNSYISPSSVWPSRAHAGAWGKVPYGTRFRLKAGFDISGYSRIAKVFLTQLKEYGLILADGGSNWEVQTSTDLTLDPDVEAALLEIHRQGPHASDMEVVDESSLMIAENSGQVRNGGSGAVLIATDLRNPDNISTIKIPLQATVVGTPKPSLWIQSGVETQLKAWVTGSDKAVKWSMSPMLGQLTTDGRYSAPSVNRPTTTKITAASESDPQATAGISVTVMPPGPIRVKVGNATKAPNTPNHQAPDYGPDSDGNMWWRDQAGEVSWGVVNDDWSGQPWPKQKDISLYYTSRYSFGDMIYSYLVPNGNYKISLYFAQPQCKDHFPREWRAPMHVEAQGKIILRDFDVGASINHACLTPAVDSIPATVTDNSLYFALRRITLPGSAPSPLLNGYTITPDHSAPRLAIDPEAPKEMLAGDHIQLHSVGWYMPNDSTWSTSGPGTINADGVYSAPLIPPPSDRQVLLEARSTVDKSRAATVKLTLKTSQLSISPANANLPRGLARQLKVMFGNAPYSNVDWSLAPNLGTITPEGLYTPPPTLGQDTKVVITARSRDLPDRTASAVLTVKVAPDTIRLHCGEGPAFKDAKGNIWAEDYGYSKDTIHYRGDSAIAGTTPDMQYLYQSARYRYVDEPFSYEFQVPNGKYAVTLKFADYAFTEPGHYSFDVKLNGRKVLDHFDPDAEYGARHANDKTFQTEVKSQSIRLDFLASKTGAFINGIEIVYLGQ